MDASNAASVEALVQQAYRWILGREGDPEGVAHYAQALRNGDIDEAAMRSLFLLSDEFREGVASIGRYTQEPGNAVDLRCSPGQLAEMLKRIETSWAEYGRTAPYWSVITDDRFLPEGVEANAALFDGSGDSDIAKVSALLDRVGIPRPGRVLDFGCGVGRLTQAIARICEHVVGADVSPGHLSVAERRELPNVSFRHIRQIADIDGLGNFDLVVSLIVLQHNPPPIIADMLERLLARTNAAVFQVPTFIRGYNFNADQYLGMPQPQMEIHALPQPVIFDIVDRCGFRVLEVREDLSIADMPAVSQTFAVQRRNQIAVY